MPIDTDSAPLRLNATNRLLFSIRVISDIARHSTRQTPVQRKEMSARLSLPLEQVDQLLFELREAGLILILRGREGGCVLARPAAQISLWDIVMSAHKTHFIYKDDEDAYDTSICVTKPPLSEAEWADNASRVFAAASRMVYKQLSLDQVIALASRETALSVGLSFAPPPPSP